MTTEYICDVCHSRYKAEKEAQECEALGVGVPVIPNGTIVSLGHSNKREIMVFAVCANVVQQHTVSYGLWGTRNTTAGDNLGARETCGDDLIELQRILGGTEKLDRYYTPAAIRNNVKKYKLTIKELESAEYRRMVKHLKSVGMQPKIYDGEKLVDVK